MFILLALGRRLCFNHILFVTLILVLSGSMNTFLDRRPVLWKQSTSCSAPALYVQPVSSIPDLFLIFLFNFAAILFCNFEGWSQFLLTEGDQHLCAQLLCLPALQLGRTARTNNCYFCLQGFWLKYLLLGLYNYLTCPVSVRPSHCQLCSISILSNACLHWALAHSKFAVCERQAFCSSHTLSSCGTRCCWRLWQ